MKQRSLSVPLDVLGGISAEHFLQHYWQKKPLLVRQAIANFESPIEADELAGLAMENDVESRIIEEKSSPHWSLRHGPFEESDFHSLPDSHWTLLIQQLDAWVPEINALKSRFDFIPNWRIDDIMASYAPDQGSVGPHFDHYDVFLLQAEGRRRWQLGQWCDADSKRLADTPLNILSEFDAKQDWILEPGDLLYLPPRLAHYGVAQGECITLSIGFRAPTHAQIVGEFADYILSQDNLETRFYTDENPAYMQHPGEINADAQNNVHRILRRYIDDPQNLRRWLGEYLTSPKNPAILAPAKNGLNRSQLRDRLESGLALSRNEGSRFAYILDADALHLFVDGTGYPLDITLLEAVKTLCEPEEQYLDSRVLEPSNPQIVDLVMDLLNRGSLYFSDDDDNQLFDGTDFRL